MVLKDFHLSQTEKTYRKVVKRRNPDEAGFNEFVREQLEDVDSGESYHHRPDRIPEAIETKVSRLPERIHTLIRDIELLHHTRSEYNHFAHEKWESTWRELLSIDEDESLQEAYEFSPYPLSTNGENHGPISSSRPMEFGEQLGDMLYKMLVVPEETEIEDLWADLLWGLMYGLCFPGPHGTSSGARVLRPQERQRGEDVHLSDQHAKLADLLERLEQRGKTRITQDVKYRWNRRTDTQANFEELVDVNDSIERILEQQGVTPTHYMVWYLSKLLVQGRARRDQGPGASSGSENAVSPDVVMDAVNVNLLVEKQALRDRVEDDLDINPQIPRPVNRGRNSLLADISLKTSKAEVSGFDVLQNIPLNEPVSTDELANEFDEKSNCAKIGLFLAKETEIHGTELTGPPLVVTDGTATDWLNASWELTPFGRFVKCFTDDAYSLDPDRREIPNELVREAYETLQSYEES